MTHEELRDRLGAYLDGELDEIQRAELELHLEACDSCRGELAALRALDGALANQPVPDPGPAYWERFADRVTERLQPRPTQEPARLYERLTGWLFPGGHFAWARAAVAVATCTLLVTVGLHGFKTAEVAVRRPGPPEGLGPPAGRTAEPGVPPGSEGESKEAPRPPGRTPGPVADGSAALEGDKKTKQGGAIEAAPRSQEGKEAPLAAEEMAADRDVPSKPDETAGAGREHVKRTLPPPAGEPMRQAAKAPGGLTVLGEQPAPVAHSRLEERETAAPAPPAASKDEGGASELRTTLSPVLRALPPPGEAPGAAPGAKLFGNESTTDAAATNSAIEISPPEPSSAAEIDSLLARDARLWPHREEAGRRPQLEALAQDLAAHAGDVRARTRAREVLHYLVETSPNKADSERWQTMLRSLPQP